MDPSMFQHLFALIERTGDRLVVVDPASRKPYVVMGLAQYEQLVSPPSPKPASAFLASQQNSANEDIAVWRAMQEPDVVAPEEAVASIPIGMMGSFVPEPLQAAIPDDDRFYVEPIE
ncbi:MAG: hypothetical protein Q7S96_02385 [bacterium]|nr:hypothetical protein [bacterium]